MIDAIERSPARAFRSDNRQTRGEPRGLTVGFSVNLLVCKEFCRSQLSWDPDTVLREQPMRHVGGNESPLHGGPKAHIPPVSARIMQDVHTPTYILQEIKMISKIKDI